MNSYMTGPDEQGRGFGISYGGPPLVSETLMAARSCSLEAGNYELPKTVPDILGRDGRSCETLLSVRPVALCISQSG